MDPLRRCRTAKAVTKYLLLDRYIDTLAAGAVQGTAATPGPGLRQVVTDTESKLSLASGALSFSGGKAVAGDGDPCLWYGVMTRKPGLALLFTVTPAVTNKIVSAGWDSNQAGAVNAAGIQFKQDGLIYANDGGSAGTRKVGAYTAVAYQVAIPLRSTGSYVLVKGGAWTTWTLMWIGVAGSGASVFPQLETYSAACTYDDVRVPVRCWLPVCLAYDTFARADGAIGSSEGAGPDGQGAPVIAWVSAQGTLAISSSAAAFSALDGGGIGAATLATQSADIIADVAVTRSGGNAGLMLRYVDADNYIYAYHDGTNAVLVERATGAETTKCTAAVAYSAGAILRADLSGANGRLFYNNALVGTPTTTLSLLTSRRHGLYSTDTGNSFDNLMIWPKGTAGEHEGLSKL